MNFKKSNKADELLKRVFKMIAESHFKDHKMNPHYCGVFQFPRGLGDDVANYVQAYHQEYYFNKRKENETKFN